MKKQMRILTPLLLGLIVAISVISIRRISDIRDYSKLINYVGIVRGASQRVVKLEMNGHPDDELVGYVEEILNELLTGQGRYGLVLADSEIYRNNLDLLKEQWETVREEIDCVRQGDDSSSLLASSEKLFEIANDTVFSIEQYSREMAEKTAPASLSSPRTKGKMVRAPKSWLSRNISTDSGSTLPSAAKPNSTNS